jgi:hypothetical protein
MRTPTLWLITLCALLLSGESGFSQGKKQAPKAAAAETMRYFELSDLFPDGVGGTFLKEVRQGGKVVSAVLDACHSFSPGSPRTERFVVELKPDGTKLVGAGETSEDKVPVNVDLVRKATGKTVTFEGIVTHGTKVTKVSSAENTDMSESEFRENRPAFGEIVGQPSNFTDVSPSSVMIKVKRDALLKVINGLRVEKLKVDAETLKPSCEELRSGEQIVQLEIDAERAAAFVVRVRAVPGVLAAGWTSGNYLIEHAVRFAATAWRNSDGPLNREKLASALSAALAKGLSAVPDRSAWDEASGELTLTFKRRNQAVRGLDLTEKVEVTAIVGPEKLSANDRLVVRIRPPVTETVDEGSAPRLLFSANRPSGDHDDGGSDDMDALLAAIASDLKGQRWDGEKASWN